MLIYTFWRGIKKTSHEEITIGLPYDAVLEKQQTETSTEKKETEVKTPNGINIELLNQLIEANPENVTQAIRDWVAEGQTAEN